MENLKKVVYTVLLGDYPLLEPEYKTKGWKLICFSDRKRKSKNWKIRVIKKPKDPLLKSREIKIKFFDFIDCDVCLYMDAKFKLKINLDNFVKEHMTRDLLLMKHNRRDCAYEELLYCIGKKGKEKALRSQLKYFKKQNFPRHFGLYAPGLMVRKNTESVRHFMKLWYDQVKKFGYRDMPSFAYTLWVNPISINVVKFKKIYKAFV
jgi:hypothetical protein